jgi:glycosyltransferase involved in cell wall biosynthesis
MAQSISRRSPFSACRVLYALSNHRRLLAWKNFCYCNRVILTLLILCLPLWDGTEFTLYSKRITSKPGFRHIRVSPINYLEQYGSELYPVNQKAVSLISVIIPCFDQFDVLPRATRAILSAGIELQQGRPHHGFCIQIVVVNDGSKSRGWEQFVAEFRNTLSSLDMCADTVLIEKDNGGLADARNTGLRFASGKWIMTLDADDYVAKDIFSTLLVRYELKTVSDPSDGNSASIIAPSLYNIRTRRVWRNLETGIAELKRRNLFHCAVIFSRPLLQRNLKTPDGQIVFPQWWQKPFLFFGWEDWSFWLLNRKYLRDITYEAKPYVMYTSGTSHQFCVNHFQVCTALFVTAHPEIYTWTHLEWSLKYLAMPNSVFAYTGHPSWSQTVKLYLNVFPHLKIWQALREISLQNSSASALSIDSSIGTALIAEDHSALELALLVSRIFDLKSAPCRIAEDRRDLSVGLQQLLGDWSHSWTSLVQSFRVVLLAISTNPETVVDKLLNHVKEQTSKPLFVDILLGLALNPGQPDFLKQLMANSAGVLTDRNPKLWCLLRHFKLGVGLRQPLEYIAKSNPEMPFSDVKKCVTWMQKRQNCADCFHMLVTRPLDIHRLNFTLLSIASVAKHHPRCTLYLHTNDKVLKGMASNMFRHAINLRHLPLCDEILAGSSLYSNFFHVFHDRNRHQLFYYSQRTDLYRLMILQLVGGTYADTDMYFVRSVSHFETILGRENKDFLNAAVLKFERNHSFIQACISMIPRVHKAEVWSSIGPKLLTRAANLPEFQHLTIQSQNYFYRYPWKSATSQAATPISSAEFERQGQMTYGYHMWGHELLDRRNIIEVARYSALGRAMNQACSSSFRTCPIR